MPRALPDPGVNRAVGIGWAAEERGRCNRQPSRAATHCRELNSDLPASVGIATRTDQTLRRRRVPLGTCLNVVGAPPIECAACISRPVPNGLCSAGRRPFPHDDRCRPNLSARKRGRTSAADLGSDSPEVGGGLLHPGLAPIFGCAALLNSLHRNEPGSHAMQDCAESLGFAASIISTRHASQHGGVDGPEQGTAFTFAGKKNAHGR